MNGATVEIQNVTHGFLKNPEVIRNLSYQSNSGEFSAVLGPSGCGKSTLLRLIAELDQPNLGTVKINSFGQKFYKAFVFQEAQLLPWRTVLENVQLPLQLMKTGKDQCLDLSMKALQKVKLENDIHKYPAELSGGMKMRVSIARALSVEPSLLLLDEPFAALDEEARFSLQEDLNKLWLQHKMSVFFVTHSVSEAVFLAQKVLILKDGKFSHQLEINLPQERTELLRSSMNYQSEMAKVRIALSGGNR